MSLDEEIKKTEKNFEELKDKKFKLEANALLKDNLIDEEKVKAYDELYKWCVDFGLAYMNGLYNMRDGPDWDLMSRLTRELLGKEPLRYVEILAKDYNKNE